MFYKKYCDFVFTFLKKSIIILLSIYDKQEVNRYVEVKKQDGLGCLVFFIVIVNL